MAKVETLRPDDESGLRIQVTELLDLVRKKELRSVVIAYRRVDKGATTFWNGDNVEWMGLCNMVDGDIRDGIETTGGHSYGALPKKDGDEDKEE